MAPVCVCACVSLLVIIQWEMKTKAWSFDNSFRVNVGSAYCMWPESVHGECWQAADRWHLLSDWHALCCHGYHCYCIPYEEHTDRATVQYEKWLPWLRGVFSVMYEVRKKKHLSTERKIQSVFCLMYEMRQKKQMIIEHTIQSIFSVIYELRQKKQLSKWHKIYRGWHWAYEYNGILQKKTRRKFRQC